MGRDARHRERRDAGRLCRRRLMVGGGGQGEAALRRFARPCRLLPADGADRRRRALARDRRGLSPVAVMPDILIGTQGFGYKDWVGALYPPHTPHKNFLAFYS